MKYDFSTYLTKVLNEEKEEKPIYKDGVFTDINKTDEIKEWIENYSKRLFVKGNDLFYKNESGEKIDLTKKNPKLDLIKMYNAYKKSITEKGVVKSYSKDTFEKLGETYAYRATVCFTIMSQSDFKDMTNDVFENDPDNVLLQIKDLQDYFDFAAACTTISKKLNKEEDKESETIKIATQYKELLNKPETRFDGIVRTKKAFEQDFTKYHDIFANAYDKGMKDQQKRMSEKDYKWEDPATGLPPKGFNQNVTKLVGKGIENLAAMGDKFAEKIKNSPHNLENDLARAAIIGVKLIGVGVHAAGKLVKWLFPKAVNLSVNLYKKITSKSVDKAINEFKKKYEEAKKGNYLPSQIKEETEEETKNKCETFKKDFQKLMYDELIPMYYKQVQVFSECYQNTNNYYILKQTKEGWETKQTENGKLTELWNAVLLLKKHIEKIDKLFQSLNLYEEFKENKMELYLGSIDKKQPNLSQKDLLTWFDKIDTSKTDDEKVTQLKRIAYLYTEDIMLPAMSLNSKTFAEYKDKLNKSLLALNKIKEIPVITELKIAFNTDDTTTNVKGIVVHKEEEQDTDAETLKNEYREIYKSLTELENTNKLDDVKTKFEQIDQIANKTASQLKTIVDKQQDSKDKTELTKLINNFENYTSFEKILSIKAIMNKLNLTESVALNTIINILNEAEETTSTIDNIKKEVTNVLKGEITTKNMKTLFEQIKNKIVELYNSSPEEIKNKLKNVKDELELLYAISAITNKSEEQPKQDEKPKQEEQPKVEKSDKSEEMKKS